MAGFSAVSFDFMLTFRELGLAAAIVLVLTVYFMDQQIMQAMLDLVHECW
jgi:hypothetical protein